MCVLCAPARAQDEEPKPQELPKLPEVLKEGTVPLQARVYLPDGRGEPRFVPNIRFAEFLEIMSAQAARTEGSSLPGTTFEAVECRVNVNGKLCDIGARVRIAVSPEAPPVSVIELGFGNCRLAKAPTFEGEGTSLWQVSPKQAGYVWWLKASPSTAHTAVLEGQALVTTDGDREVLELSVPAAPTTLSLEIPKHYTDVRLKAASGEIIDRISGTDTDTIQVRSSGGPMSLNWQVGTVGKRNVGATEIKSRTVLQVDDPRSSWEADSKITLRQFGDAPSDMFTVVLPPGSAWLPLPLSLTQQYSVTLEGPDAAPDELPKSPAPSPLSPGKELPAPPEQDNKPADSSSPSTTAEGSPAGDTGSVVPASGSTPLPTARRPVRLRVRLLNRTPASANEPIVIRWQWTPDKGKDPLLTETPLPQLVIEGSDRHELTTELDVPTQYVLDWKGDPGVELLQHSRPADVQGRQTFLFRAQREHLNVQVAVRRGSMVPDIHPTYLAEIDRSRIKLRGWYECVFDRGEQPELRLNHEGWILETAELVADATSPYSDGDYLSNRPENESVVTLSSESIDAESGGTQNRTRQLWRVIFYRSLVPAGVEAAADSKFDLELKLPRILRTGTDNSPQIDEGSGVLMLSQANNVSLRWNEASTRGVIADALSAQLTPFLAKTPAERIQCFRFQNKADAPAAWVGRMEILPRVVSSESIASVSLRESGVNIVQTIHFQIANEPVSELSILMQESVIGPQSVSVFVDGTPCTLQRKPQGSTATSDAVEAHDAVSTTTEFHIVGVSNLLGRVTAEFRCFLPLSETLRTNEAARLTVPLIVPASGLTGSSAQRVLITVERPLTASLAKSDEADVADDAQWRSLDADPLDVKSDQSHLTLRLRKSAVLSRTPVRIARVWQQTVMNGQERVDRFAARVETTAKRLTFTLPHGSRSPDVAIDGVAVQPIADVEQGRYQVDIPATPSSACSLEIWTSSYAALGWFEGVKLEPIEIEGCSGFDRAFWQLVLPAKHHLALAPDEMNAEWNWQHNGLFWNRRSAVDQEGLEQWIGASNQPPIARSANVYLLSTYGAPQEQMAWVATRLVFWLPVGIVAVFISVSLAVWRKLRHPAFLIMLAALLFSLALVWPDMAIMALQTTVPAVSIVLLFALTQAAVESRVRRRSIFTTRPTSGTFEGSDHGSLIRPLSNPTGSGIASNSTRAQVPATPGGGGNG
ncbi:MAG: hypothetical protein U0892_01760 [Pirellulales bacterium]